MGIKKIGYGTNLLLYTLIFLAILTTINFIFYAAFYRIDLTENKIYSISKSTKDLLRGLNDVVNITAYFSKELPPQLVDLRREIRDILDEYKAYAGNNITVAFVDPEDDPELSQRMQFIGIPKVQVNIFQKDKAEVANLYLGMSIMFEDRKEVIPVIQNVKNLEYELTSAILKVTKKKPEVIGFVNWEKNKEVLQQDPFSSIQMALQKQYDVRNINLSPGESVLQEIDTLVLLSPKNVTDKEKRLVDQFLMRGGKEIYLVDMIDLRTDRQLAAEPVTTNINDLLAHYGIKISPDLVLDRSNSRAAFSGGFFHFQVPYPFWPKVLPDGFDQSQPMVSKLETITLPWTSSVKIDENIIKEEGLKSTVLAKTTPHGWTQKGNFDLNPQQRFDMRSITLERVPLAVMVTGLFKSFYANRGNQGGDDEGQNDFIPAAQKETHIVAVGNSRFIQNDFLSRFPENGIFFLNIVDWLTIGDALIGIRTREKTERPIPADLSESKKALIRYTNIFAISILVILLGLIRFWFKKRKRLSAYEL